LEPDTDPARVVSDAKSRGRMLWHPTSHF